jgi:type I restriction enzyme M protein
MGQPSAAAAADGEDRLRELRRNPKTPRSEIEAAEAKIAQLRQKERDENAKAQAIENAAFDLKDVNPNAQVEEDHRTPAEILDFIEAKGREIAEALAALRA